MNDYEESPYVSMNKSSSTGERNGKSSRAPKRNYNRVEVGMLIGRLNVCTGRSSQPILKLRQRAKLQKVLLIGAKRGRLSLHD